MKCPPMPVWEPVTGSRIMERWRRESDRYRRLRPRTVNQGKGIIPLPRQFLGMWETVMHCRFGVSGIWRNCDHRNHTCPMLFASSSEFSNAVKGSVSGRLSSPLAHPLNMKMEKMTDHILKDFLPECSLSLRNYGIRHQTLQGHLTCWNVWRKKGHRKISSSQ